MTNRPKSKLRYLPIIISLIALIISCVSRADSFQIMVFAVLFAVSFIILLTDTRK